MKTMLWYVNIFIYLYIQCTYNLIQRQVHLYIIYTPITFIDHSDVTCIELYCRRSPLFESCQILQNDLKINQNAPYGKHTCRHTWTIPKHKKRKSDKQRVQFACTSFETQLVRASWFSYFPQSCICVMSVMPFGWC